MRYRGQIWPNLNWLSAKIFLSCAERMRHNCSWVIILNPRGLYVNICWEKQLKVEVKYGQTWSDWEQNVSWVDASQVWILNLKTQRSIKAKFSALKTCCFLLNVEVMKITHKLSIQLFNSWCWMWPIEESYKFVQFKWDYNFQEYKSSSSQ